MLKVSSLEDSLGRKRSEGCFGGFVVRSMLICELSSSLVEFDIIDSAGCDFRFSFVLDVENLLSPIVKFPEEWCILLFPYDSYSYAYFVLFGDALTAGYWFQFNVLEWGKGM